MSIGGGGGTPKPSKGEKLLAQLADRQWEQFQTRFVPVENEFIKKLKDTEGRTQRLLGQTNAEVTQRFAGARKTATNAPMRRGATAGSGAGIAARENVTRQESSARAGLMAAVPMSSAEFTREGLTKGLGGATGQKRDALNMLSGAAQAQTSSAIAQSTAETANRGTMLDLAGSAAAVGYSAYNMGMFDRANPMTGNPSSSVATNSYGVGLQNAVPTNTYTPEQWGVLNATQSAPYDSWAFLRR